MFPFAAGPHTCIGNHVALMEAPLTLATLAQRVTFALVPGAADRAEAAAPKGYPAPAHGWDARGGAMAVRSGAVAQSTRAPACPRCGHRMQFDLILLDGRGLKGTPVRPLVVCPAHRRVRLLLPGVPTGVDRRRSRYLHLILTMLAQRVTFALVPGPRMQPEPLRRAPGCGPQVWVVVWRHSGK